MAFRRIVPPALFALGVFLLSFALVAGLASRLVPAEGMGDLGLLAAGVMGAAVAGFPFSLFLLMHRALGYRPRRLMREVATAGALVGLAAGLAVASVNERTLLLLGAPLAILTVAGIVVAYRAPGVFKPHRA